MGSRNEESRGKKGIGRISQKGGTGAGISQRGISQKGGTEGSNNSKGNKLKENKN